MISLKEIFMLSISILVILILYGAITGDVEFILIKVGKAVIGALALRLFAAYLDNLNGKSFKEVTGEWNNEDWAKYYSCRILGLCIFFGFVFL